MMTRKVLVVTGMVLTLVTAGSANVFNMGGTRNSDGTWTGLASLDTLPVGDANNAGELSGAGAGGYGPDRICGSVSYAYSIGKYEVTVGQYTKFLNAVARTDTYGLYSTNMDKAVMWFGCNIKRSGSSGCYTYTVGNGSQTEVANWGNRPVNFVSYWDSCRFTNWLQNGQPTGEQGPGTTEDGAYTLTTDGMNNNTIVRNANWKWAVTSEDEWYKAAYYDPTTSNYYNYPTSSDSMPSNILGTPTDPGNNATYYNNGYTIDSPYYRTEVGAHENSDSPFGTFDQGGNLWEWNEAILYNPCFGSSRGLRGGSINYTGANQLASTRNADFTPADEAYTIGFRVSAVPEPATIAVLALGGLAVLRRKQ
jgi:formylglycine-generating enzyme